MSNEFFQNKTILFLVLSLLLNCFFFCSPFGVNKRERLALVFRMLISITVHKMFYILTADFIQSCVMVQEGCMSAPQPRILDSVLRLCFFFFWTLFKFPLCSPVSSGLSKTCQYVKSIVISDIYTGYSTWWNATPFLQDVNRGHGPTVCANLLFCVCVRSLRPSAAHAPPQSSTAFGWSVWGWSWRPWRHQCT